MTTSTLYCGECGAENIRQARFCFFCGKPLYDFQLSVPDAHASLLYMASNLPINHVLKQRYRICSLLGEGGMGAVYRVEDMQFGNRVLAMKEMRQAGLSPQEAEFAIEAFKREALLLAGLMHPHIPRFYDHFSEAGRWYLIMDFIEGSTLEQYQNSNGQGWLPVEEVINIGLQLCAALDYLHSRQPPIIFRDLKPANVLRTPDRQLYLIDFGIARHFKPGQMRDTIPFGSVGYAAPEQYGRVQTSPRADIYSLGATLHQLLSGHNPTLNPFRFAPFGRADHPVPAELEALIMRMIDMDEYNRPASIALVREELQQLTARQTAAQMVTVRLETQAAPPERPTTRRLAPVGTTLLTYREHSARILGLAWSPDGSSIASASGDKTVQVWNAFTGKLIMSYPGHTEWVKALAWSPNSRYLASAGADMTVQIWDALTGRTVLTYRGHTNIITTLAWSPNGRYIVSGGYDRTIQVWDAYTGEEFGSYHGHSPLNTINAVAWSPDSRCIASASDDKTVHLWSLEQVRGTVIKDERLARKNSFIYTGHSGWVKTVAWSPNGRRIASGSWDNTVHLWDAWDGSFVYAHTGHTSWLNAVAWSPNGTRIASASNDGTVHLWEANTGREVFTNRTFFTYRGHFDDVKTVAWSPDGTRVASGGNDTVVQVWDAG